MNRRPRLYQRRALPTELPRQKITVGVVGVEPTGSNKTAVLQTVPAPYGTTHPFIIIKTYYQKNQLLPMDLPYFLLQASIIL